jgi:hypothetical protein
LERPSRAKKNYRPAQVILDNTIQRRTSEQVKADQAKAKADAAAAEAADVAHQQNQKNRVAALEDAMQAEEYAQSLEDLRPDLHHKSASNTDVETLSDSHMIFDDPIEIPREPLTGLPPDGSSYRDSSHSEEFLTGWEELEENQQDQDYLMPSDNESEASHASQASQASHSQPRNRTKAKFKPQYKVSFFLFRLSKRFLNRRIALFLARRIPGSGDRSTTGTPPSLSIKETQGTRTATCSRWQLQHQAHQGD